MKVFWTYMIITFSISLVLTLGGVIDKSSMTAMGLLSEVLNADETNPLSSSALWDKLFGVGGLAFVVIVGGFLAANAVTGGNASVGITAGYSALAFWSINLVIDWINVLGKAKVGCTLAEGALCSIGYYILYFYIGLLVVGFIFALVDLIGGND